MNNIRPLSPNSKKRGKSALNWACSYSEMMWTGFNLWLFELLVAFLRTVSLPSRMPAF